MSNPESAAIPSPLVAWETAVGAVHPTLPPTRARYRTVRDKGRVSTGVQAQRRDARRAVGSQTVHSTLVVFAAHALRAGDDELATELLLSAEGIERTFGELISGYLARHDVHELRYASFYDDLIDATAQALAAAPRWRTLFFAHGVVRAIHHDAAEIVGETETGEIVELDLPSDLLTHWQLKVGDGMFVFRHLLPTSAALVELLPTAPPAASDVEPTVDPYADLVAATMPRRDAAEVDRLRELARAGATGRRTIRLAG